jgi:hypothetical protein
MICSNNQCYSPYSLTPRLFVLFLASYSSPVGNTFLRLVSLYVPCRTHFFLPFPLVTDLTPFSELPTEEVLSVLPCLPFLADSILSYLSDTLISSADSLVSACHPYYSYDSMMFFLVLRLRVVRYLRTRRCTLVLTFDLRNLACFIVQDRSS